MIRQALPQDAARIAEIWNAVIRDTLITFTSEEKTTAQIAHWMRDRDTACIIYETETGVQGFASFGPFRSGPGYAHVVEHTVYVAPTAQERGVGRALLQRLEEIARADGRRIMIAGISGANPGAVAFHARMGFREVGHLPGVGEKAGQMLDLLLMQKNL